MADLGASQDGARLMELAALVVHPAYRCNGLGDSLLDYVEQDARRAGYGRCLLVQVGRGGYDWFMEVGGFFGGGDPFFPTGVKGVAVTC